MSTLGALHSLVYTSQYKIWVGTSTAQQLYTGKKFSPMSWLPLFDQSE